MKIRIDEDTLRELIRETILEALDERGTNMDSLYHFTSLGSMSRILKDKFFNTNGWQKEIRGGKNYVSFTRHRTNLEGFAKARDLNVRIEVDGRALSNKRYGSVEPFEYYSPKRRGKRYGIYQDSSAKSEYANGRKHGMGGEHNYMSQAEESFTTDRNMLHINNLIRRIDINAEPYLKGEKSLKDLLDSTIMDLTSTGFKDKVFIYPRKIDFNLQNGNCITVDDYIANTFYKRAVEESRTINTNSMKLNEPQLRRIIREALEELTAYHGGAAAFDRFDMSKAHTGEGGTMYGLGVYVTTNPETAKHYMNIAAGNNGSSAGYLYEVQIPEDNGRNYVNIEKNNPQVYDYIEQEFIKLRPDKANDIKGCLEYCKENDTIMWLFTSGCDYAFDEREIADLFKRIGIVGIRVPVGYRDAGLGQYGGYNYTIFDGRNVRIVKRQQHNI